jgi:hypothetical protein
MLFCQTFGVLVPPEPQRRQHQGGQRDGAYDPRAHRWDRARMRARAC